MPRVKERAKKFGGGTTPMGTPQPGMGEEVGQAARSCVSRTHRRRCQPPRAFVLSTLNGQHSAQTESRRALWAESTLLAVWWQVQIQPTLNLHDP